MITRPIVFSEAEVADMLIIRAKGRCEVSGIPFSWDKPKGHNKRLWSPSLDRMDCKQGYELENVRLVCAAVNVALNDFGVAALLKISRSMVEYHGPGTSPAAR